MPIPGRHNVDNAVLAIRMAVALGVKVEDAVSAMKTFGGVERRLQRISPAFEQSNNRTFEHSPAVYDDYAHNPEKIAAMWTTLAEKYPAGICVIWRPHGYGPLRKLLEPLAEMFNRTVRPQDKLLLLPVYDAGGTASRDVNSPDLSAKIDAGKVELVADLDLAYGWCAAHAGEFAAFVTCGARDPGLPLLAKRLAAL